MALTNRFSVFGNISNDILELYPPQSFDSLQQAYDSISADIGTVCGNQQLANMTTQGKKQG